MTQPDPQHCQQCGGRLLATPQTPGGGPPYLCSRCGSPTYLDPKVAAAAIVESEEGIVLVKRAQRDQAHGLWILPGGHVDRGEAVIGAAAREAREETGLKVDITGLVGVYSYPDNPVVLVVYAATPLPGPLTPGPEALDIRIFPPESLPWERFGYFSTGQALKDYLTGRRLPV